eukprot:2330656-Karenia_brevis.AAC.1
MLHQAPRSVSIKRQVHCAPGAKQFSPSAKRILHEAPSSVSTKRQAHFGSSGKQRFQQAPS